MQHQTPTPDEPHPRDAEPDDPLTPSPTTNAEDETDLPDSETPLPAEGPARPSNPPRGTRAGPWAIPTDPPPV